ncbi:uncharacterized protein [Pagrus major]|uniref:uncharacterized protein n=1 Tax=Pagrus major TaxID=143350 RepID=UPI003CC887EC
MKIMFGLKTMAIMWMLKEGRGMVDTLLKINLFFPSRLLQYQDQCTQREMFLMRKNHLDFKSLALALAMDKVKLEDYILNQLEKQYGGHYAKKVEDRLLCYLHKLETVLPGDTYIDKILKKGSPVTEDERLLLEVITSDSMTIATTLKNLLHCDVASCSLDNVSTSSKYGKSRMENSQTSQSILHYSSSKALLKSAEAKTPLECQPEVFRGEEEADKDVSKDSPLLFENDNVRRNQQTEEDQDKMEEESTVKEREEISQRSIERIQEVTSSPQFCSKHQRWVNSILQQCPDECSEELLLQATVSSSPPLFQSSSSTTTSQDLTPSDLVPCPPDQHHAAQAREQVNPGDKLSSGSLGSARDTSQREPLPQPSSSRDTLLPVLLSPVVQLINIASVRGINRTFKLHKATPNQFTRSSNKQAASATSLDRFTSGNDAILQGAMEDSTFNQPETLAPTVPPKTTQVQTAPVSQDASTSTSCQPPTRKSFSRLSRKVGRACSNTRHSQALDRFSQNHSAEQFKMAPITFRTSCPPFPYDVNVTGHPTQDSSASTCQSGTLSSVCTANQIPFLTESSRQVVPESSVKHHPQTLNTTSFQRTLLCSTDVSTTSNSICMAVRSETNRVQRAQPRLSLTSQVILLHSKLLQPYVSLTRLSAQKCYEVTKGRSSSKFVEPMVRGSNDEDKERRKENEGDADSSFDLNTLYSSYSSNGGSEDSLNCDPDYKPRIKKKRLL